MKKIFKHIYFELTDICNRSCSFCPEVRRDKLFMPAKEAFAYLDQAAELTEALYWHVQGEPLLHPQFREITSYACDLGLVLKLTTNGTFVKKYEEYLLSGKFSQINFSIQSLNETDISEKQRILEDIASFIEKAFTLCPEMYINLRYWQNSPPDIEFFSRRFNIPAEKWLPSKGRHSIRIKNRLYCTFDREFIWPENSAPRPNGESGSCKGLIDHIGILCDGRVVPCCLDSNGDLALGDLHTDSLKNILNSPRAIAMADNFKNKKRIEPLCRKCDFASRFDSNARN